MRYLEMRTVVAMFENNATEYSYFVPEDDHPEVGDYLVTSVSWTNGKASWEATDDSEPAHLRRTMSNAKMARVVRIEATPNRAATRFYVQLISHAALGVRQRQNEKLVADVKARRDAKVKLDKMLSERNVIDRYRELAASNPEAAALLALLEGN